MRNIVSTTELEDLAVSAVEEHLISRNDEEELKDLFDDYLNNSCDDDCGVYVDYDINNFVDREDFEEALFDAFTEHFNDYLEETMW